MFEFDRTEVLKSKEKAREVLANIIAEGKIERKGVRGYYDKNKFILSWYGKYNKMCVEHTIEYCDESYRRYSGYSFIYCVRNLFIEKQIKGFITANDVVKYTINKIVPKSEREKFKELIDKKRKR